MARPFLVTGANGFAGGHLIDLLGASGHVVFAWIRPGPSAADVRLPATTVPVDILDRAAVERELGALKPQAIFHCAGAAHVGASWHAVAETLETNVRGTHHLLEADRRLDLGARILIPGSSAVYRPRPELLDEDAPLGPDSPYAVSKLAQERLAVQAAADGQRVIVTRSFNHIGPRQSPSYAAASFARQIARIELGELEPVIRTGNLDAVRDLTDVRDTVRAYALLAEHGTPGVVYNVCSGQGISMADLLERLVARAQVPVEVRPDPALLRPADAPILVGDNTRLVRAVGWHPSVPLDRTLDDLLAYWRMLVGREREGEGNGRWSRVKLN